MGQAITDESRSALDAYVHEGARRMLQKVLECEVEDFLARYADKVDERGRRQVVDADLVGRRGDAEVVAGAVHVARLHTPARHSDRIAVRIVVPAEDGTARRASLAERRAAELAGAEHERVVEEAAAIEILYQGCRRLVERGSLLRQPVADALVRTGPVEIPAPVEEMHEADALLDEPAGTIRSGTTRELVVATGTQV